MTEVSCSASTCLNNNNGLCSAKEINILGKKSKQPKDTKCETYSNKDFGNLIKNAGNLNITGAISQVVSGSDSIKMTPRVRCSAKECKYESNNYCKATNILIEGRSADTSDLTDCSTFTIV